MVTHPFTTSIKTEIQTLFAGMDLVKTFAKDLEGHWLIVNTNVVEGTDLPAWVTDEFYFLLFERKPGNMRTSTTQGYHGGLACQLLAGNTFQQINQMDSALPDINVTMPIPDGDSVRFQDY